MDQVLVFRTSVENKREVKQLRPLLNKLIDEGEKWNFDLEDCDRILRVESSRLKPQAIISALAHRGINCEELAD